MKLEDQGGDPAEYDVEVENVFRQHYLAGLGGPPPFVCLESEDFVNGLARTTLISAAQECTRMIKDALDFSKRPPLHSLAALFPSCS